MTRRTGRESEQQRAEDETRELKRPVENSAGERGKSRANRDLATDREDREPRRRQEIATMD
jgi:hypothetical protein